MSTNYKVLHKRSGVEGKKPTSADIVLGEIAINFAKDKEFLSILNGNNETATFSSDNYYTEQKLGSGFTDENSGRTVTEALENLEITVDQVIDEETKNSPNPVSTKAVYEFVSGHTPTINVDQIIDDTTSASTNAVATKAVYNFVTSNVDQEINSATSASTNAVATKAVVDYVYSKGVIDERDFVISESLNDLEQQKMNKDEIVLEINSATSASSSAVSVNAVSNYTYSKSEIDTKVASGGTFDPTQYYTIAQTNSAISTYAYSKNDIVTELGYEAFSTSSTYSVGDVVRYNNTTLYKFVVDHPAGAWDSSQVVQTSVNKLIQDTFDPTQYYTKSEIEDMEDVVASSLNDLRTNKVDGATMSAFTYSKDEIDTKISSGGTFDPTRYYTKAEIDSNERVISKALNDLNTYRNFYIGSNVVNTLTSIPITKRLVVANGITSSSSTLTLGGTLEEGTELYIIVQGTAGIEITLDSNMINTSGDSIVINNNGYCEISIISVNNGNTYYVRGV